MEMAKKTVTIDLGGPVLLLGVVFVVLKLAGVIDWSWWIVTAPLWAFPALVLAIIAIPFVALAFAGIVLGVCALGMWTVEKWEERKWRKRK
jgi:hypothetical protein